MNICLKCQSAYEKPGTCNCYAERAVQTQPYVVAPLQVGPFNPIYPGSPGTTAPAYPWWLYQTTCGGA